MSTNPTSGLWPDNQVVPGRAQRRLVVTALVLLLVPGIIGFDLWPLTAWRLFSLARTDLEPTWEIEAVDPQGGVTEIGLDTLPIGYQLAEWHMAELDNAPDSRRDDVCAAFLQIVSDDRPGTAQVNIVRNDRRLVRRNGSWIVDPERRLFHSCGRRNL